MDAPIKCSGVKSGACYLEPYKLAPPAHFDVLATDYSTYMIMYSCSGMMSEDEYLWIYTRRPLSEGTDSFKAAKATISAVLAEKLPWYPQEKLMVMKQDAGMCRYNERFNQ